MNNFRFLIILLIVTIISCSQRAVFRNRFYQDWFIREILYDGKHKIPAAIQIYVGEEFYKKSKMIGIMKYKYTYIKNSDLFFKEEIPSFKRATLVACICDNGIKLSKQDSIIIDRIKFLTDSLNWTKSDSELPVNGFRLANLKKGRYQ